MLLPSVSTQGAHRTQALTLTKAARLLSRTLHFRTINLLHTLISPLFFITAEVTVKISFMGEIKDLKCIEPSDLFTSCIVSEGFEFVFISIKKPKSF